MWHIELVKNKYESLEDLYSLLQYVFRLNKTADDSRRANINGCKQACVDLQKKAIVSNCQFANCTGFNLITSTTNSEVKIED